MLRLGDIRAAILASSDEVFEEFTIAVLQRTIFAGLVQTSRTSDRGQDGRTSSATVQLNNGKRATVACSITSEKAKIEADCVRCSEMGHPIDLFVFVTPGRSGRGEYLTESTKDSWKSELTEKFGWEMEVYTAEYLAALASQAKCEDIVDDLLHIPPPGGDYLTTIKREFRSRSQANVPSVPASIAGIHVDHPDLAVVQSRLREHNAVLVTGCPGEGKTGVAHALAREYLSAGKPVLVLDARDFAAETQPRALSDHLNLNGSLSDAIGRVGSTEGCLVVIDQLDSIHGMRAANLVFDLARKCVAVEGVEIVVLSRTVSGDNQLPAALTRDGFVEVKMTSLTEATARPILDALDITSWPISDRLPLNLLNLYIVSRIIEVNDSVNLVILADEVKLWRMLIATIEDHESLRGTPADGKALTVELIRLARMGLSRQDRSILLDRNPSHPQERALFWGVIQRRHGLVGEFHHEQLRDFYVAVDAVDNGFGPEELIGDLDPHRLSGVIVWIDKLYRFDPDRDRAPFLRRYLVESSGLTAHSRAALLSQYMKRDISTESDHVIDAIWDSIREQQGLRRFFFTSVPHYSWAVALEQRGALTQPPPPIYRNDGNIGLPGWDAQSYLEQVATSAADVVLRHLEALNAAGVESYYVGRALDVLSKVPLEKAATHVDTIVGILSKLTYSDHMELSHPIYALAVRFAADGMKEQAFALFEALTAPKIFETRRGAELTGDGEEVGFASSYYELFTAEIPLLRRLDPMRFALTLEAQLDSCLRLSMSKGVVPDTSYSWRSAIEDTDQDDGHNPREKVLISLRDTLDEMARTDSTIVGSVIARYLDHDLDVFRRLAIHLVANHPDVYPNLLHDILLDSGNLADHRIHHEYFRLLRNGYVFLEQSDRAQLVGTIRAGLAGEELDGVRQWFGRAGVEDVEQEVADWNARWIRDRLLMIAGNLCGKDTTHLRTLLDSFGEPEHPDFLMFHAQLGVVRELSTLSAEQVLALDTEELCSYVSNWTPTRRISIFEEESPRALGATIAKTFGQAETDAQRMTAVCRIKSSITEGIFNAMLSADNAPKIDWLNWVPVVWNLLQNQTIRDDQCPEHEGGWYGVRLSITRLLERGLDSSTSLPCELLVTVKQILNLLSNDPDPSPREEDQLANSASSLGPLTQSINHTRPMALGLRIRYEVHERNEFQPKEMEHTLPPDLRALLELRLDPSVETSMAVRSTIGQSLRFLHYLDPEWVNTHIDEIFPEGTDPQSEQLFIAAWDGFLLSTNQSAGPDLRRLVQPKVGKALRNLSLDRCTSDLDMHRAWAQYVMHEYLEGTYLAGTRSATGSLLEAFYAHAPAKSATMAAWVAWRACVSDQKYWCRVQHLWLWRVSSIREQEGTPVSAAELGYFAQIPEELNATLSLREIKALLMDTIAFAFTARGYGFDWESVENFLASRVQNEPRDVVDVLRSLVEADPEGYHYLGEERRRMILETACANEETRAMALEVIDLFLTKGDARYSDIYNRLA